MSVKWRAPALTFPSMSQIQHTLDHHNHSLPCQKHGVSYTPPGWRKVHKQIKKSINLEQHKIIPSIDEDDIMKALFGGHDEV